jgi:hypothetical protein
MRLKDPPNFNNGHNFNRRGIFLFVVFTSAVLGLFLFSRNGNYRGVDGSAPGDMKSALACVELCREIGNSAPLRPFVKRKVMPDNLKRVALEDFVRSGAMINLASDVFCQGGTRCSVGCRQPP